MLKRLVAVAQRLQHGNLPVALPVGSVGKLFPPQPRALPSLRIVAWEVEHAPVALGGLKAVLAGGCGDFVQYFGLMRLKFAREGARRFLRGEVALSPFAQLRIRGIRHHKPERVVSVLPRRRAAMPRLMLVQRPQVRLKRVFALIGVGRVDNAKMNAPRIVRQIGGVAGVYSRRQDVAAAVLPKGLFHKPPHSVV